nr:undecaprenyl-diphosphate phosphatase [Anaerovorax odorimutans]
MLIFYVFEEDEIVTFIQAVILGLAQGLAEFLPISSSGHLALLQYFFDISAENVLPFAVLLHLGTLISIFVVYWKDIVELVCELFACIKDIFTGKGPRINANPTRRLGFMILVATIPTAIIGLAFNDLFAGLYLSLPAIGFGLLITGTILVIAEKMATGRKRVEQMKFRNAVLVGLMQGIAIWPGISRSGSTLFGGLVSGLNREFAVKFAFLISIPSILGSVIVEAPDAFSAGMSMGDLGPVIVGVIVSAVSGFFAIKTMIRVVSNKKLTGFSIYTWALGALVLLYAIFLA